VQSDAKEDSRWVFSSCLNSSFEDYMAIFMVVLMNVSIEATVALSCFIYFWVLRKLDCKVLKRDSSSWLWVWAMRMGELKRGGWGQQFLLKNDMDECDKGEEMNPME
jgi:hypothetical protein